MICSWQKYSYLHHFGMLKHSNQTNINHILLIYILHYTYLIDIYTYNNRWTKYQTLGYRAVLLPNFIDSCVPPYDRINVFRAHKSLSFPSTGWNETCPDFYRKHMPFYVLLDVDDESVWVYYSTVCAIYWLIHVIIFESCMRWKFILNYLKPILSMSTSNKR